MSDFIDWVKVNQSFDKYFENLDEEGCCVVFEDREEIYVFMYRDMKIGDGEGNYYK